MWKFPWKPTGTVLLASLLAVLVLCAVAVVALLLAFQSRSATDLLPAARVVLFVANPSPDDILDLCIFAGVVPPASADVQMEAAAALRNDDGTMGVVLISPILNLSTSWPMSTKLPYTVLASSEQTLAHTGRSTASLNWSGRFRQWQTALLKNPTDRWWYGEQGPLQEVLGLTPAEIAFLPSSAFLAFQENDDQRLWLADIAAPRNAVALPSLIQEPTADISGAALSPFWTNISFALPEEERGSLLSHLEQQTQSVLPGISLQYDLLPLLHGPSRLQVRTAGSGTVFAWQFVQPEETAAAVVERVQQGFLAAVDLGEIRSLQLGESSHERSIRAAEASVETGDKEGWAFWKTTNPATGRFLITASRKGHIIFTNDALPDQLPEMLPMTSAMELRLPNLPALAPWRLNLPWHVRLFAAENRTGMLFFRTVEKAEESLGSPLQTP